MSFSISQSDFQTTYWVFWFGSIPLYQVPAVYCLSPQKAQELLAELSTQIKGISLVQDNPEGPFFSNPNASIKNTAGSVPTVPFLQLTGASGKTFRENAGLIANWWNHGYDPAFASSMALADLNNQIATN